MKLLLCSFMSIHHESPTFRFIWPSPSHLVSVLLSPPGEKLFHGVYSCSWTFHEMAVPASCSQTPCSEPYPETILRLDCSTHLLPSFSAWPTFCVDRTSNPFLLQFPALTPMNMFPSELTLSSFPISAHQNHIGTWENYQPAPIL